MFHVKHGHADMPLADGMFHVKHSARLENAFVVFHVKHLGASRLQATMFHVKQSDAAPRLPTA
jgi:hypothetical protein